MKHYSISVIAKNTPQEPGYDRNAFKDEQKDSCSWAAFGDEQAGESHHRKETWQSHRTDASARSDGPVLHKSDSVALASFQGTISKQSQELSPSVQVRVCLIFLNLVLLLCMQFFLVPASAYNKYLNSPCLPFRRDLMCCVRRAEMKRYAMLGSCRSLQHCYFLQANKQGVLVLVGICFDDYM